jgi:hypothetical protein
VNLNKEAKDTTVLLVGFSRDCPNLVAVLMTVVGLGQHFQHRRWRSTKGQGRFRFLEWRHGTSSRSEETVITLRCFRNDFRRFFTSYSTDGAVTSLQYLYALGIAEKHRNISATTLTKVLTLLQTRLCAYH